ncbi:MAG: type IX secretion system sortase PorU [Bacteroidota bacterium]|nr:type IX secretion system sortase PorU [Bacteroidota bacterium]
MNSNKIRSKNIFPLFSFAILITFIFIKTLPAQKNTERIDFTPDYKIINSTQSYIELEFYPQYNSDIDFMNSISNPKEYGSPDVKLRSFPIYFPTNSNNRVEIIDSKYEEVPNIEVKPVPVFKKSEKKSNKKSKDQEDYIPEYNRDEKIYNSNNYFPANAASVNLSGALRNKYFGYLNVYPVLYNPMSNSVRKYNYIKLRVTFGGAPVNLTKSLGSEERSFLRNTALNFEVAANWSTREFNFETDTPGQNSVLATGDFYKIEVNESGMYRINKNFFNGSGINTGSIDPRTIKIFGNGGAQLPYKNSAPAPTDLVENRIYVSGQEDGQFNDDDYILFYGRNPNEWTYDTTGKTYFHAINHFAKTNYYWFTFGGSTGQRMETSNSPNVSGISPLTKFKDRLFEEPEINNLGSTGYLWVSQSISSNENFTFNKELKGYVDGSNVNLRFRFGNGSFETEIWRLEDMNSGFLVNQQVFHLSGFSHINLVYLGTNQYVPYGVFYPLSAGKRSISFKASLPTSNGNSSNVRGYYDYLEVLYDRVFSADNNTLRFNTPDTSTTIEYQINNFSSPDIKVFDVTHPENVSLINPISFSNGVLRFQSNIISGSPKEYYTIAGNNYKTPSGISSRIPNQNIKGDLAAGCSFIIISPKEFIPAANRLKAHREIPGINYLKTHVIDIKMIYNEFSDGLEDPVAIRNFLKYAYNNWQERPVYVLFFGDGSYDYKNIYNLYNSGIRNWIPPIQQNSDLADDVNSFCSDDYIVEINEDHNEPSSNTIPDFSSGRLCINSVDEANITIDKIFSYEDPANFGKWKTEGLYVADDGWTTENTTGGERDLHTGQCERLAQIHTPSFIKKNKVYIVSYPAQITPQGRRKPGANLDIVKYWNEGQLVINYTGHGSTDLWAHEHVFEKQVTIPQLTNKNKYPFVSIASCDLARWDDPFNVSAAEELINVKDKGAIGISAATRAVFSAPNETYNNLLYDNLFKIDTLNLAIRMGKAVFNVKQSLFGDNDLKFALLGDPTIRLGVPHYRTKIDSINSIPGDQIFDMKALQRVKISGSILREDSSFWSDYSGNLDLKVLDVDKNILLFDFGWPFNYTLLGGIIYTGTTNVQNGKWNVEFIVPRDISYNPGNGKMFSYFKNNSTEGIGFSNKFRMNGLDSTAAVDSTGPVVSVYMDNRNFRSGDMVNQNPKLIADFTDESGINLTGTIGHKIEAILNDDENHKIDLTPFYSSNSGFQNGTVEYQMENIPDGKYKLDIKAWDTYNNFSTSVVDFNVANNEELTLDNIYNYPNPMQDFTSFIFQHNSESALNADIRIYTVSGRLIKELNKTNITDKFVNIDWDGKDSDGDQIANGTYVYKIVINSEDGNFSKSSTGKLAKLK